MIKTLAIRYRFFLVTLSVMIFLVVFLADIGQRAADVTVYSMREMLFIIPPIFILLGILDVWVPRDVVMRHMGPGSGAKGIGLAMFLGSAAAGPLYGAFPVAAVFLKKGVKLSNIYIFLGAWSTTKIPLLLFEISALGPRFALTRLLVNLPGILLIAYAVTALLKEPERAMIYQHADTA